MNSSDQSRGFQPAKSEVENDLQPKNTLAPALIQQFLANQTKELDLKTTEIELAKQKDSNGFEYAKQALEAQARDRSHQRELFVTVQKNRSWLIFGISALVAIVIGAALFLNKETVAIEIIKAAVLIAGGFLGGFGVGRSTTSQNPDANRTPQNK